MLGQSCTGIYLISWLQEEFSLQGADGILVPGGFGDRGVQGKILDAKYAREKNVPYLGICLGMQIAVVEYARHVMNLTDANSTEFDSNTKTPCVIFMPEGSKTHMGATMRLGSRRTFFKIADCKSSKLYGNVTYVDKRHQHRYEVNPDMVPEFEKAGLQFVGKDDTGRRMEMIEMPNHRYFVGAQFHPEFKSRPSKPSPLFVGLIAAASGQLDRVLQDRCNGHVSAKHVLSNGSYTSVVHQNGNPKKLTNGLSNGTYYANGNGVHA